MSRPFSLLLIALGLAILGSLVYLHFHLMERQHTAVFTYASNVNKRVIEQKRKEIDMLHRSTQEFFLDEIYARRSFVLDIFAEAELRLETYFDSLETLDVEHPDVWPDVQGLANLALSPVIDTAVMIFRQNHLQADMREEDMLKLVREFEEMRHGYLCTLNPVPFPSPAFQLEREVITLELLADVYDLLLEVVELTCYTGCFNFESYFPIVMADANIVKAGETMKLKMAVGSYSSALRPEDVVLLFDGDTVRIGYDGTADYTLLANVPGEHTVATKCIVSNPLTGMVQIDEGKFSYFVY